MDADRPDIQRHIGWYRQDARARLPKGMPPAYKGRQSYTMATAPLGDHNHYVIASHYGSVPALDESL